MMIIIIVIAIGLTKHNKSTTKTVKTAGTAKKLP